MADRAPVMLWMADAEGRCTYLSKSWYDFTGLPPGEDKHADWAAAVHPEDLPEIGVMVRRQLGAPLEYRMRCADGDYRWLLDTAVPSHDGDPGPPGYIGSMTDITDRKMAESSVRQSEQMFRTLANSIPQLAWMARPDGKIFWYNQRWYDYTGSERGTAESEDWWNFHGSAAGAGLEKSFRWALRHGLPFQEAFTLRRGDGEYRWHLCQMLPVHDPEGNLRLWFGTHTDITEEREAQHRKDLFLATLAHELRNPLAPILTGLEVIRSSASDGEQVARVAAMMERQTGQMVHLIDDLLDMSRINTGKIVLKKERVPLDEIIGIAVEASQPVIRQYGHDFRLPEGLAGMTVEVDPHRMAQVISNLLSNAAKYTPPGGHIRLLYGVSEDGGPWVAVEDDGAGIAPERRESIFDLFEQDDHERQDGLGIGLTLVKSLVELHGGVVEVHSEGQGTGSRFTVCLPACTLCDEASPAAQEDPTAAAGEKGAWRRVLVVDDGKPTADILAMFFEMEGKEVSVAYDGEAAVAAAAEQMPDLIMMDLGMPRMDGFEAARRIRQLPDGAAVMMVALSGWGREEDRRQSRDAGFDEHMVKPVSPGDLRELMGRLGDQ